MTEQAKNHWHHESDWLRTIEMTVDEPEDRASCAENIGYLMGWAFATNIRMLALLSDPKIAGINFVSCLHRLRSGNSSCPSFAQMRASELMVGANGFVIPSVDEIRDARPIQAVLPKDVLGRAWMVAAYLCAEAPSPVN